jgi:RHS repeat-associated protein
MLGRNYNTEKYRYSFQNQEHDDEIKGRGNSINYTFRMHDPRLGRFFAVDPLAGEFPWNSSYAFSENVVINAVELEGRERKYTFNSLNAADNFRAKLSEFKAGDITYNQLVNYLNAHSISYMHENARDYVREQLGKGNNQDDVHLNKGDKNVKYITHNGQDGQSTDKYIMLSIVVQTKDGGYDRESIQIDNPDYKPTTPIEQRKDPTYYEPLEGDRGAKKYIETISWIGDKLEYIPPLYLVGKGFTIASDLMQTAVDFEKLDTKDAVKNFMVRGVGYGIGEGLDVVIDKNKNPVKEYIEKQAVRKISDKVVDANTVKTD